MPDRKNRYTRLIEDIFDQHYREGAEEVAFERDELVETAKKLGIKLPKNLGDVVYSFRYRANLPASIRQRAPAGLEWVIRPTGQARYRFSLASISPFANQKRQKANFFEGVKKLAYYFKNHHLALRLLHS